MAKSQAKTNSSKTASASNNIAYSKEQLLSWYEMMVKIRRFEERTGALYGQGLIGGFCHLYIGQEAVVTGFQAAIKHGDQVTTTYRDHAHMIAIGTDPKIVFAELMGRADGCSRGKGGSMHMFDLKNHFYGGHGIVGANVPIGAGLALANQYMENDSVSLVYYGDGASNQGQVFETYNMASLWKLPVIFIIENNHYAMGTSTCRAAAKTEYFRRGEPFGIPGERIDGQDVIEVYEAAKRIVDHVRSGKGPYLVEVDTYRYRGHSMSDPAKYRSKDEVEKVKTENDPIDNLRKYIETHKVATEADFKKIEDKIKVEILAAVEFSHNSPEPDACELYTDVLAEY